MDAFAVSVASGISLRRNKVRSALLMAAAFGLFQMIMPVAGWFSGTWLRHFIEGFDHYIAFGLLALIGGKMIYEAIRIENIEERTDPFAPAVLFVLAVATSVDAFAVGLSFAILKVPILMPVVAIGLITFGLSFAGVMIGERFGHFFEKRIEIAGGLILIGIGSKILIEHII